MTIEQTPNRKTYNVIITGQTLDGLTPIQAHQALAKLFKTSVEKAQAIFEKAPYTVKSNADEPTAKKYQVALKKAQIDFKIQQVKRASTPLSAKPLQKPAPEASSSQAPTSTPVTPAQDPTAPTPDGLEFTLQGQPDYAFLTVQLAAEQTIKVEASSMATMDTHIKMRTKAKGGFGRLLTGENLFINEFTAEHAPGEIGIAPGVPGDILHNKLKQGESLFLQNSAYLASSPHLEIETKLDIFKGIFSGAGLVLIKCSGPGDLWFNTYGAAIEIEVDGQYVVDTDKIIAWEEGLTYDITKVGGYKSLFFSGEGFVCRFSGKGKLWIQTRSSNAFKSWAHWYRPVKSRG